MSRKAAIQAEDYKVTENSEQTNSENISEQQQEADGMQIEGFALPFNERSRNGVIYEKESVKKAASTMEGNPILFNHDQDNPIGHVKEVEVKEDGLYYIGDVNPERREVESLQRGDIPHVSIQAMVEETENTSQTGEVAVTEFLELSAVTIPGFPQTDVQASEKIVNIESLITEEEAEEKFEDSSKEQENPGFEFQPVPDLVLYKSDRQARARAEQLGVEGIHQHSVNGEEFYMAGQTHGQWLQLVGKEGTTDDAQESNEEDEPSAEPFAGYDDFDDCVSQNQDKADPEAYCGVIKKKTEQSKNLAEAVQGVETVPTDEMSEVASEVLEKIEDSEFDNDDCGTRVGLERANQLENREELSADTINRMVSFFARHDGNQAVDDDVESKWEDCGFVAWQLWGGDPGREWAERKQEQIEDAKNEILGANQSMKDETREQIKEQLEAVDEDDFMGTVADMYEEVSASDAASLMDEFTFTGNPEPLVALVADAADMSPADLMDMLDAEEGMHGDDEDDMEDEEGDAMDDEEDDEMEESESSDLNGDAQDGNNMDENLQDEIEELKETVKQQAEMIEKLEDTESSKQEGTSQPNTGDGKEFTPSEKVQELMNR